MTTPPKEARGLLFLLSGPTGSGKSTLCDRLVAGHPGVERVVTCTTRPPREGEKNGVDYHFLSNAEFDDALGAEEFLEWAQVHNSRYGTKKIAIFNKLARGTDLVVNVDVQGARAYRQAFATHSTLRGRLVGVFVLPPDMETIFDRMLTRGKETKEQMERRMKTALHEVDQWPQYDYCIVSDTKDSDYLQLESIWRAEKCRASRLQQAVRSAGSRPSFGR
ncbi:MAG: guanylate kinase [Verrucomicrobia bacterium RIFCSPLOWO2_12_FULL_64_8]|nr:MAG: guanylate kinase [Verrucomicrobia bacterium RIFCSPLOWO2_12_FULL_64_8]